MGPVSVMPMPLHTRDALGQERADQALGQRRAAAAPVAHAREVGVGEARRQADRLVDGRHAEQDASRGPRRSGRAAGSTSNLASTVLVPPARNSGSVCRLMPAVWNSGRKLTVRSAPLRPVACCTLM